MREMAEVLLQRPGDGVVYDEDEMIKHVGIPKEDIHPCTEALAGALETVLTAGALRGLTSEQWVGVLSHSPTPVAAKQAFAVWLGTPSTPAQELALVGGLQAVSMQEQVKASDVDVDAKKRGGGQTESAERIAKKDAWPPLDENSYYPPATFDVHMMGCPSRDAKELKKLVVKEVLSASPATPATPATCPAPRSLIRIAPSPLPPPHTHIVRFGL